MWFDLVRIQQLSQLRLKRVVLYPLQKTTRVFESIVEFIYIKKYYRYIFLL
jgi:hypothetical protein